MKTHLDIWFLVIYIYFLPIFFLFSISLFIQRWISLVNFIFSKALYMGCGASQASFPVQSIYGSKCVPVDTLSPQNKKKIRKIIEKDNLVELAITISQLNIPLNVELSDVKSKWFMTHFCARWDSANCLQYLLKHFFVGSAIGYIDYVNATTVDGETPLHLAATYKCDSAFAVLHYFGGLNLNARDKNSYTPLESAQSNKAKNISEALKKYRQMNTHFTNIDAERLTSGKLISQEQKNKVQVKVDKTKQQNNQNTVSEEQKNLMMQKKKLEQMMSDLQKQKLQLQYQKEEQKNKITQNDKKVGQKQLYEKEMQDKINAELKKQKQKYDLQIKQQQAQLQKLKDQIRRAQDERIAKQKQQAQRLAQRYAAQQEEKLKQLAQEKEKQMIEMKKAKEQQLIQNPEGDEQAKKKKQPEQQQTPDQAVKVLLQALEGHGLQIPPHIQQIYRRALEAGEFIDQQFPPDNTALGDPNKERYYQMTDRIVWLRPYEIFGEDEPYQLFKQGIDPNDINQGQLGVCYMLAAVSSMAQMPHRVEDLFVFEDANIGFYVIKLYKDGIPQFILVDDLIPCDINSNAPIFTKPVGSQLWVMLIQKCWSKVMGGYLDAEGMMPDLMMQDLSGAPGFGQFFNNPNKRMTFANHVDNIYNHIQEGHHVVISTGPNIVVDGIVQNHAYTLLNVFKIKDRFIFKIRNPWGKTEFQGTYSQNSKQLTQQIKNAIGYDSNLQDGIFYLSTSQVQRLYEDYSICVLLETHYYSYVEFSSKMQQSIYFKFTLTQKSLTNIRVTQPFDRMIKDQAYRHAPVVIEVGKIQKNGKVKFIDQGESRSVVGEKSIHAFQKICQDLQAGDYFVRVRMIWPNDQKYNSAVLSVYAIEGVQIEQLEQQQGLQLLKQLYISHSANAKQRAPSNDNIGTFKVSGLKGQFTFVAQTDKPGNYKAQFSFYNALLTGVSMQIGMINGLQAQCQVSKGNPGVITTQIEFPQMMGAVQGNISCNFIKI